MLSDFFDFLIVIKWGGAVGSRVAGPGSVEGAPVGRGEDSASSSLGDAVGIVSAVEVIGAEVCVIGAVVGVIGSAVGVIGAIVGATGAAEGVMGAAVAAIGAAVGVIGATVGVMGASVGREVGVSVVTMFTDGRSVGEEVGVMGAAVGEFVLGVLVGALVTGAGVGLMEGIVTVNSEPQFPEVDATRSPFRLTTTSPPVEKPLPALSSITNS